jgi:hypothetical protein
VSGGHWLRSAVSILPPATRLRATVAIDGAPAPKPSLAARKSALLQARVFLNRKDRLFPTHRQHEDRAIPDLRAMLDLQFERVIISHGEPVHTRDAFKRALELPQWPAGPLHQAAYRGNLDRVRSLVEAGADVTARDERFGATALDWAGWTKQAAVVAYLKSVMKAADHSGD